MGPVLVLQNHVVCYGTGKWEPQWVTGFLKVFIRMGFCSLCFGIELKIVLLLKENTSYFHVHAGKVKKGGGGWGVTQPSLVQCWVKLEGAFRCTRSKGKLKSTLYFTVFVLVFLKFLSLSGGFWNKKVRSFLEKLIWNTLLEFLTIIWNVKR